VTRLIRTALKLAVVLAFVFVSGPAYGQQRENAYNWLEEISHTLAEARDAAEQGRTSEAQTAVMRVYLDRFEILESYYGGGGAYENPRLAAEVAAGESEFHALLRSSDAAAFAIDARALEARIARIRSALRASGLPAELELKAGEISAPAAIQTGAANTPEIQHILRQLSDAATAYQAGDHARAQALVEQAYLEGFEPLESRLPGEIVDAVEKRVHLELRPAINQRAAAPVVAAQIAALNADLVRADRFLDGGSAATFATFNSFIIIVREGLEAVLLIAALLAYLTAIGASKKNHRHIYAGVGAGVLGSILTWLLARSLIPISGANRELIEGVTALVAVGVLLYVAHWLFQKTYIHDWKNYLRDRVGGAVTRGSAFALGGLAFAAVYREGFETVLFYQALAFDAGATAVLVGFVPGLLLIVLVGAGIIRAGLKLPLKRVFACTNAILLYLAFVFIGKGLYNLQEAGLFAPHPIAAPDHPALRQMFGFYPLIETLAAQAALLFLLFGLYLWYRKRLSGQGPQTAPLPEPLAAAQPASPGSHRSRPEVPSVDLPRARARSRR